MKIDIGPYPKKGRRRVHIKIHEYDVWNFDKTLAHIIVPGLKLIKKKKKGVPIDFCTPKFRKSQLYDKDEFKKSIKNWNDALDKMIYAFECLRSSEENVQSAAVKEGLQLFGKYISHLWI